MAKRYRVLNHYVVRDKYGQFKRWSSIGRSTRMDARTKAKLGKVARYGHLVDYKKKGRL
jgi:hypothetical protein